MFSFKLDNPFFCLQIKYGCPALLIKYVVGSESPQSLVDHVEIVVSIWQEVLSSKKKVLVMRRRLDLLLWGRNYTPKRIEWI